MKITNFNQLAHTPLRTQALHIVEAGLLAVDTKRVIKKQVVLKNNKQVLEISGKQYILPDYKRVITVGFGKCAFDAVAALQEVLGEVISCGFVLDVKEGSLPGGIVCHAGSHPYPTQANVRATHELVQMLATANEKDLIICVVSGGGSSLLCSPYELTCEEETSLIAALTVKGASMSEINTVRKHTSKVKGGNLAALCYPATVVGLLFSDVPGADSSVVASGPTMFDTSSVHDAQAVLQRYNVLTDLGWDSVRLHETPKEKKFFEKVTNTVLVSAQFALDAMSSKAKELGWKVEQQPLFSGEAREVAQKIVSAAEPGLCLVAAGESVVTAQGPGLGGRNQELALAALSLLDKGQVLVACASDGSDNTDAAGALVDAQVLLEAKRVLVDPVDALEQNDSYHFFESAGGHVFTGNTGSNVADLVVLLTDKEVYT